MNTRKTNLYVPKERKPEVSESLGGLKRWFDAYKGSCLFVTDENGSICQRPAVKCHAIPEATVLSRLVDEKTGKVLEFQWGVGNIMNLFLSSSPESPVDLYDPVTFEPIGVGTGDASVGKFACGGDDQEFGKIDCAEPNIENPTVSFLLTYRPLLYLADLLNQGSLLVEDQARHRHIMRGTYKKARSDWLMCRERIRSEQPRVRSRVVQFGKIWCEKEESADIDPNLVSGQLLWFRSKLRFAASMFYGDGLAITVTPTENDWHRMAITHLEEDSESVSGDKEAIVQTTGSAQQYDNSGVDVLKRLTAKGTGRIAASLESYRALDYEDRQKINQFVGAYSNTKHIATTISHGYKGGRKRNRRK